MSGSESDALPLGYGAVIVFIIALNLIFWYTIVGDVYAIYLL